MIEYFNSYYEFETYINGIGLFHVELGLERIRKALASLDLVNPPFGRIHVLGTNGKGSTARFISDLSRFGGLKTGLYTSPHFLSLRERALVDGRMLSRDTWLTAANRVYSKCSALGLTYFEYTTLIALEMFTLCNVQLAVIEAGLGGLNDATNAIDYDLTVFTMIGLDHESIIGPTIKDITLDKAGAMKKNKPVVTFKQSVEVMEVLYSAARKTGTEIELAEDIVSMESISEPGPEMRDRLKVSVLSGSGEMNIEVSSLVNRGEYLYGNIRLALAAWSGYTGHAELALDAGAVYNAFERFSMPGRFQRIGSNPEVILDAAHNPAGLKALGQTLKANRIRPEAIVFTCLGDKNLDGMLAALAELDAGKIIVPALENNKRSLAPGLIVGKLGQAGITAPDVRTAMELALRCTGCVLVCGSMYLLAEVFELHPDWLEADNEK